MGEAGLRCLYAGVTPYLVVAGSAWGLYFFFYNGMKSWLEGGRSLFVASMSEVATLTTIWVVKRRLCLQQSSDLPSLSYTGLTHALASILRREGLAGLYSGFSPGLLGVSHGAISSACMRS